jgi:hypothetical protein
MKFWQYSGVTFFWKSLHAVNKSSIVLQRLLLTCLFKSAQTHSIGLRSGELAGDWLLNGRTIINLNIQSIQLLPNQFRIVEELLLQVYHDA